MPTFGAKDGKWVQEPHYAYASPKKLPEWMKPAPPWKGKSDHAMKSALPKLSPGTKYNALDGKTYVGDADGVPQYAGWWKTKEGFVPTIPSQKQTIKDLDYLIDKHPKYAYGPDKQPTMSDIINGKAPAPKKQKTSFLYDGSVKTQYTTPPSGISFHAKGGVELFRINNDGTVWASPDLKPDHIAATVIKLIIEKMPAAVAEHYKIDPFAETPTDAMLKAGAEALCDAPINKNAPSTLMDAARWVWTAMWHEAPKKES